MRGQVALSRPSADLNTRRLTQRQRDTWMLLRGYGGPLSVKVLDRMLPYRDVSAALCRLEARGLVRRPRRGYYAAVWPDEVTL